MNVFRQEEVWKADDVEGGDESDHVKAAEMMLVARRRKAHGPTE